MTLTEKSKSHMRANFMLLDRETDRQSDRQTDSETVWQIDRPTDSLRQ